MEKSDPPNAKRWSVLHAAIGGIIGVVPGFVCWYFDWAPMHGGILFPLLIGAAGAFIGVVLTRPDVSASRVLKGTAVLTIAKAVPGPLREPLYSGLFRDENSAQSSLDQRETDQAANMPQSQGES